MGGEQPFAVLVTNGGFGPIGACIAGRLFFAAENLTLTKHPSLQRRSKRGSFWELQTTESLGWAAYGFDNALRKTGCGGEAQRRSNNSDKCVINTSTRYSEHKLF